MGFSTVTRKPRAPSRTMNTGTSGDTPVIPIILVGRVEAPREQEHLLRAALELRAFSVLSQPVDLEVLLGQMARMLDQFLAALRQPDGPSGPVNPAGGPATVQATVEPPLPPPPPIDCAMIALDWSPKVASPVMPGYMPGGQRQRGVCLGIQLLRTDGCAGVSHERRRYRHCQYRHQ